MKKTSTTINPLNRTTDAFHQLALAHMDLIGIVVAANHFNTTCTFLTVDDFKGVGYVALYKAAEQYDETKGIHFRAFAYTYVRNALIDSIRKYENTIRYPHSDGKQAICISLDQLINNDLEPEDSTSNEHKHQVFRLIQDAHLTHRERNILCNKYDIMLADEPLNTQELADHYHMTPQHVNRICRSAIDKLRVASVTA